MADITNPVAVPVLRHLRAEPTSTSCATAAAGSSRRPRPGVLVSSDHDRRRGDPGRRPRAAVSLPRPQRGLPAGDRAGRDHVPRRRPGAARRPDRLHVDLESGGWSSEPLEQVGGLLTQLAQQFVIDQLAARELRAILTEGVAPIRARIGRGTGRGAGAPGARPAARRRPRGRGGADDRGREGAAAAHPRGDPDPRRRGDVRPPRDRGRERARDRRERARQPDRARPPRRAARRPAGRQRAPPRGGGGRRAQARGRGRGRAPAAARPSARPTRSTSSRRRSCAPRASGPRSRRRCPPTSCYALALQELAGQLGNIEHLSITPDLVGPLLQRLTRDAA